MAVRERLVLMSKDNSYESSYVDIFEPDAPEDESIGRVEVDILNDNVVVTIRRIDEAKFGPVSVVVV